MTSSKPALTKYTSFEALKQNTLSVDLPAAEKERLDAEAKQMAELLQTLRRKQDSTIILPAVKAKEISDFAEFVSKFHEEQHSAQGIQQLVAESKTFNFLNDEEDLYTEAYLKEVYNG